MSAKFGSDPEGRFYFSYKQDAAVSTQAPEYYAQKWKTFFEKLVRNNDGNLPLPFIASVSRNTARLLIALQDLGAFDETDARFNFKKAQMFANCILAFIGHCGNHSFVEMAEVYNRLLDEAAIHHIEEHKITIVPVKANERVEEKLPYYRYGDYASFFHKSYAEEIIKAVPQLQKYHAK